MAPKIDRKNLRHITVKEGEPIYLDVKVSGEPAPDCQWYINGKTLVPTNHKRVEDVPYNTKLYNDSPERKDTGTYKLVAQNKYGQDQAEIEITIICKYSKSSHTHSFEEIEENKISKYRIRICFTQIVRKIFIQIIYINS